MSSPRALPFVSDWEKTAYYHGVSVNPPVLLYRSNWRETPFPRPVGQFQCIPVKTAQGVFETSLNPVWRTVAPQIRDNLKAQKLRYAAVHAARFSSKGEDGHISLGPVIVWIAVHPGTTTAADAHEASPRILALLEVNGVHGAVVEWFEGAVEKLSGPPPLLRVTAHPNPTYHVRRFLTAGLGMPIATERHNSAECEGSVAFFFHETQDRSSRVLGVSSGHVLREDITVPYVFQGAGEPAQHVRIAGVGRFQRGVGEIKSTIAGRKADADRLVRDIENWKAELQSEDAEEAEEAKQGLDVTQTLLPKTLNDITVLEAFDKEVNDQWADSASRRIGRVDWVPAKSTSGYSNDIGTFEVETERFKAQFKGNVVDLGSKFTPLQVEAKFAQMNTPPFKYPTNRQLRIQGCVAPELLAHPDTSDSDGKPGIVVMKDGSTTDLTFGRYAGLEAYTCDYSGAESIELAFYNHDLSENFAAKGDSGSLVFDGQGRMVGIPHAGLVVKEGVLVTYATPAWWAVEQLKKQYPHAEFDRKSY